MGFKVEGVHHVGIPVRDMKRSFEWYSSMFGLEPGPVNHNEGPDLEVGVQVPGAKLDYSMLEVGNVLIEFLEYQEPTDGKDFALRNCDVGAMHVCLQVDDMDAAYASLTEKGAVFNAPPFALTEGSLAGSQWAYLRDPDGIQLELWQYPKNR
ncbi:VOC family protein [Tessaracoccus sp. MC1756]|uniref:VOC family protein n=1 Tax=Tessaracoccus sp. MC1756 TaxID=2760311 RepID=UPI0016015514|nr:VOC family protein [Tessaracoccus sp. MC1756]MBB1510936.1 VOC family protein [Tessaracoccus sp. MC1756]